MRLSFTVGPVVAFCSTAHNEALCSLLKPCSAPFIFAESLASNVASPIPSKHSSLFPFIVSTSAFSRLTLFSLARIFYFTPKPFDLVNDQCFSWLTLTESQRFSSAKWLSFREWSCCSLSGFESYQVLFANRLPMKWNAFESVPMPFCNLSSAFQLIFWSLSVLGFYPNFFIGFFGVRSSAVKFKKLFS